MALDNRTSASGNFLSFSVPVTTDKLEEKAREELNETPEVKEKSLQKLKALVKDHNGTCITRDDFLLRFLRSRKFDVQRSFESLQNYTKQMQEYHKNFLQLKPEVLRTLLELKILGFLPYRDSKDRLIFFYRSGIWNRDICTEEELVTTGFALLSYAAEDQMAQISGLLFVVDHTEFSLANMMFIMRKVRTVRDILFKCLPARYPQIHMLTDSEVIKTALQVVHAFLPEKIRHRILFHGKDSEELFQHISPAILPSDFGGSLGPLTNEHLFTVMEDYLTKLKSGQYNFYRKDNIFL